MKLSGHDPEQPDSYEISGIPDKSLWFLTTLSNSLWFLRNFLAILFTSGEHFKSFRHGVASLGVNQHANDGCTYECCRQPGQRHIQENSAVERANTITTGALAESRLLENRIDTHSPSLAITWSMAYAESPRTLISVFSTSEYTRTVPTGSADLTKTCETEWKLLKWYNSSGIPRHS